MRMTAAGRLWIPASGLLRPSRLGQQNRLQCTNGTHVQEQSFANYDQTLSSAFAGSHDVQE